MPAKSHGLSKDKLYRVWASMISRCNNKNNKSYKDYGERGIAVCDRWRYSFENFLLDMGRPEKGFEIDRIDNNSNYEPMNCRWVSRLENAHNKRNNRFLSHNGQTKTLAEWASCFNVNPAAILYRIKAGWTDSEIFEIPFSKKPNSKLSQAKANAIRGLFLMGRYTKSKIARLYDVNHKTIHNIINNKIWVYTTTLS